MATMASMFGAIGLSGIRDWCLKQLDTNFNESQARCLENMLIQAFGYHLERVYPNDIEVVVTPMLDVASEFRDLLREGDLGEWALLHKDTSIPYEVRHHSSYEDAEDLAVPDECVQLYES